MVIIMIKNIIFDFGNVLINFDEEYMTSRFVEDSEEIKIIKDVVFDRLYFDRLDRGNISDEEIKEDFKRRLPENLYNKACLVFDRWEENIPDKDGMRQIVKKLHKSGYKLFILSNISSRFADNYNKIPNVSSLFEMFDGFVFSAKTGFVKPQKEIFDFLTDKYSLEKSECLFIDDSKKNTDGAKAAGIAAYLFDGDALKLENYLKEKKILE